MKQLRNIMMYYLAACMLFSVVYATTSPLPGVTPFEGGATFRTWAPNATFVQLYGSF